MSKRITKRDYAGGLKEYEFSLKLEAALIDDWSPYAEVRAVTELNPDYGSPCETPRVDIVGLIWGLAGCVLNTFFAERFPSISLSGMSFQLLIYPTGKLLEWLLPDWGLTIHGHGLRLNPGPWCFKEQMLATLACPYQQDIHMFKM